MKILCLRLAELFFAHIPRYVWLKKSDEMEGFDILECDIEEGYCAVLIDSYGSWKIAGQGMAVDYKILKESCY